MEYLQTDLQYFPSVNWFKASCAYSHIVFKIYERYPRRAHLNRCTVAGANNLIPLSIPLLGGRNQQTSIADVQINNSKPWQREHWKTIVSCYKKSPWFDHYQPELEELYNMRYDLLSAWNLACLAFAADKLDWSVDFKLDKEIQEDDLALAREKPATTLTNGETVGRERTIRYHQVFEERFGFRENLSILDLLFCEGKNARQILSSTIL